jgi:adenylate kinase
VNWLPELRKGTAILITGTPGTGKTTVSRLLATELRATYVNPKNLLRRRSRDYVYDKKRKTRIVSLARLHKMLYDKAKRAPRGLVIDSHITPEIGPIPKLVKAIVLRCDPVVLQRRLARKRWPKSKISENLQAEILDVCLWEAVQNYGLKKTVEIDTTEKTPKHIVQLIMKEMHKRRIQKQTRINWLLILKRKGTLIHYFE